MIGRRRELDPIFSIVVSSLRANVMLSPESGRHYHHYRQSQGIEVKSSIEKSCRFVSCRVVLCRVVVCRAELVGEAASCRGAALLCTNGPCLVDAI